MVMFELSWHHQFIFRCIIIENRCVTLEERDFCLSVHVYVCVWNICKNSTGLFFPAYSCIFVYTPAGSSTEQERSADRKQSVYSTHFEQTQIHFSEVTGTDSLWHSCWEPSQSTLNRNHTNSQRDAN